MRRPVHRAELIWSLAFVAIGLVCLLVLIPYGIREPAYAQPPPGQFPRIAAGVILVASALLALAAWRLPAGGRAEAIGGRFFILPAFALLFAFLIGKIGFLVPSIAAFALMLLLFGERRPAVLAGLSVAGPTIVLFAFIHLLNVPLALF